MATLEYVEIPSCATRLQSNTRTHNIRSAPKIITSLPRPEHSPVRLSPTAAARPPMSPSTSMLNMPQMILASTLQLPAGAPSTPRDTGGSSRLLSTRDPLSLPITTVNFRRFIGKVGPVFWLQDRLEEILLWRKGWKHTVVWMSAYAFLCYFPRMILLIPHVILLSVLLATHPSIIRSRSTDSSDDDELGDIMTPPPAQTSEGSVDWLANVQAIQNLMGAYSDVHDFLLPTVPHFTYGSQYTPIILSVAIVTFLLLLPLILMSPLRPTFLVLGLGPFLITHPFTRFTLWPSAQTVLGPSTKRLYSFVARAIDNDRLEDKHWQAEMREVELWENERWNNATASAGEESSAVDAGWSKENLRPNERKAWTRGRDGWSGIVDDGSGDVSSNLTFSLAPGWSFVETEDWRPDLEATWNEAGADEGGWVYTNDAWVDPQPVPLEEWRTQGMTRRRRWTRRIYYDPSSDV